MIEYNGEVHSISEWGRRIGITSAALGRRLRCMSVEEAFTKPNRKYKSSCKHFICENCGKEFTAVTSARRHYCTKCRDEIYKNRHEEYKEDIKKYVPEEKPKPEIPTDENRRTWGHNYAEMQKRETLRMLPPIIPEVNR